MTANQIAYWQLKENERSHLASEGETNRANLAKERENYRSNTAKEKETNRANLVNEALKARGLAEDERSNKAREAETNRSNVYREEIDDYKLFQQDLYNSSLNPIYGASLTAYQLAGGGAHANKHYQGGATGIAATQGESASQKGTENKQKSAAWDWSGTAKNNRNNADFQIPINPYGEWQVQPFRLFD